MEKNRLPTKCPLNRTTILLCGGLAILGASGAMVADVLSLWIPDPELTPAPGQSTADWLMTLLGQKSSFSLIAGSLLGLLTLPLHLFGFFLISTALKPAGRLSLYFFAASCVMTTIGTGFHGSIALVGEAARNGDPDLFSRMMQLFFPWWWMMTLGFLLVSGILVAGILRYPTHYTRKAVLFSPLVVAGIGSVFMGLLMTLPIPSGGIWFFAICGINLPLLIFHAVTTWILLRAEQDIKA